MRYHTVLYQQRGSTVLLTLNRPERLNAYTPEMGEDLVAAFRAAAADDEVAAVIVTGAGQAFCAGADRACLGGEVGPSGLRLGEETFVRDFALELADHPKLTIAAFNGVAVGIGITMSLCLDLRLAAADTRLKLNFAELGIVPGLGSSFALPRLMGLGRAKKLLLCERELSAEQALSEGLVEEICAPQNLLVRAEALAAAAAACRPDVVAAIKRSLNAGAAGNRAQALTAEQEATRQLREQRRRSE
ncbi:MAG TPA: enoyl-CoA hydratase/isomerase family protein [Spongiibacteraceae bacterium]|jgi:enoyl-CoA hydratase/carnithine racemase|nr:enoyl-CoA hydratase/isomerase family protein [Spongiibacteraceae bacterium]